MASASVGLARNLVWLTVGETATKVCTFLAFTYLGRTLGPERYGDLELSLGVVLFFSLFVQMGLGAYGAREIAREPQRAQSLLGELLEVRMLMAVASVSLLLLFAWLIPRPAEVFWLLAAYGLSLLATPFMLLWFFQGHDRMHWVAAATLIRQAAFAAAVFALFRSDSPLWSVGLMETAAVVVCAGFCAWVAAARMGFHAPRPSWDLGLVWGHLRLAVPIGLSNLAWAALWFFPLILLGLMRADESVGWFGAAHRITMAVHTFVWWYFFNMLPSISRLASRPRDELRRLMEPSLTLTAWGGPAVALAIALPANALLTLAYGSSFSGGGAALAVLIWSIPVAALSGHYRFILIGFNLQDRLLAWVALSVAVACGTAYALIPTLGGAGAAWGLLAGNAATLVLCYGTVVRRVAPIGFLRAIAGPALATILASAVAFKLVEGVWPRSMLALGVYAIAFAAIEGRRVPQLLRRLKSKLADTGETGR